MKAGSQHLVCSLLMLFMLEFLSNSQTNQHCKAHPAGEEQKGQGRWAEVLCRVFASKYLPMGHFNIPRGGVCVFWQCLALPVPWAAPQSCLAFPATHCLQPQKPIYLEQGATLEK